MRQKSLPFLQFLFSITKNNFYTHFLYYFFPCTKVIFTIMIVELNYKLNGRQIVNTVFHSERLYFPVIYRGSRMAYTLSNCLCSNHYSSHTNHTWDKPLVWLKVYTHTHILPTKALFANVALSINLTTESGHLCYITHFWGKVLSY